MKIKTFPIEVSLEKLESEDITSVKESISEVLKVISVSEDKLYVLKVVLMVKRLEEKAYILGFQNVTVSLSIYIDNFLDYHLVLLNKESQENKLNTMIEEIIHDFGVINKEFFFNSFLYLNNLETTQKVVSFTLGNSKKLYDFLLSAKMLTYNFDS